MTDPQNPSLTVLFMPESAYGPTNQCIGLGKVLLERGHTVVFAAERSWEGKLAPLGFVEALVDLAEPDPDASDEAAGQFWIDFINETAPEFRKPTIEQLTSFVQPTYQALIDGAKYCEPQLRSIIAEHRPDVLVEDNVVSFPALTTSGSPYVRIVSCNPLEIPDPQLPPVFSGLPAGGAAQLAQQPHGVVLGVDREPGADRDDQLLHGVVDRRQRRDPLVVEPLHARAVGLEQERLHVGEVVEHRTRGETGRLGHVPQLRVGAVLEHGPLRGPHEGVTARPSGLRTTHARNPATDPSILEGPFKRSG